MEKSKIYTKTGDRGSTSLVGGKRVPKTHPRIEAYGTVDELNAFIACLMEEVEDEDDRKVLLRIQYTLFSVGTYLATEGNEQLCKIEQEEVDFLENEMDKMDALLPPLKHFILPGGCKSGALAHVCRTVSRRAERCIYQIPEVAESDFVLLRYVNRLSDYFFLFARRQCFGEKGREIIWESPCK